MKKDNSSKLNIISEVLLEIRFTPPEDISLMAGRLYEKLKSKYPEFVNLNVPEFPNNIPEFNKIVRYRFFSSDRKQLYNIGNGVLSINTLNYSKFTDFQKQIRPILESHKTLSGLNNIQRIGLRYINKIPLDKIDKNYSKMLKIKFSLPDVLKKIETGFSYKTIGKFNNTVLITSLFTPPFSKEVVTLDFDCYTEKEMIYEPTNILSWSKKSYGFIKKAFIKSLTTSFLSKVTTKV
jgi:uncharacterized protein (TIGR04255 family)